MTHAEDSRRVSLVLGLLFGLGGFGSSSAAVVLGLLADDLGVSLGLAAWTISAYLLLYGVSTAIYGRVADLIGIRTPLLIGVALMTMGALLSAAAPSFPVLLVGRVLQGAGAAAIPTLGVAAITARYEGGVRSLALGRLAAMTAALSCLGPLVGGLVEEALGWRAVMALPALGVLVLPLVWHALGTTGTGARLDLVGAVLVAGVAGGLVLLVQSPSAGLVLAAVGLLFLIAGVPLTARRLRTHPHGFLPLDVVRNRVVVRSALAAASIPACWFALLVAVPAVLTADGWTPFEVGLLLVPSAVVAFLVPGRAATVLESRGAQWTLRFGTLGSGVSLLLAALGSAFASGPVLGLSVVALSVAFGFGQPALMTAVGGAVAPDVRGVALGIAMLVFMVGGSIGSAVVGGLGVAISVSTSLLALALLPCLGSMLVRTPGGVAAKDANGESIHGE